MPEERRRSCRVQIDCETALHIGDAFYTCQARNIAESGILIRSLDGPADEIDVDDEGSCWLGYQDGDFEARCRVIRVSGADIALFFLDLEESQKSFLEKIIAAH